MEKKYIKPEIQVVEIELQPMMAASLGENELGLYNEDATDDAMSKGHGSRFDVWGPDEE
ncbi:MAG: hypothetical protein IKA00_04875 [Prevotella sp.]|nr:hypothetical protein [Prevotella sp.]